MNENLVGLLILVAVIILIMTVAKTIKRSERSIEQCRINCRSLLMNSEYKVTKSEDDFTKEINGITITVCIRNENIYFSTIKKKIGLNVEVLDKTGKLKLLSLEKQLTE